MISVTGVTDNYSLQPALLEKHARTLSWLSASIHWKSVLAFYQKKLNEVKTPANEPKVKEEIEKFDNQILYFTEEGIEDLRRKLRNHESRLAKMLAARTEWDIQYYKEHDTLMVFAAKLAESIDKLVNDLRACKVLKEHVHTF